MQLEVPFFLTKQALLLRRMSKPGNKLGGIPFSVFCCINAVAVKNLLLKVSPRFIIYYHCTLLHLRRYTSIVVFDRPGKHEQAHDRGFKNKHSGYFIISQQMDRGLRLIRDYQAFVGLFFSRFSEGS